MMIARTHALGKDVFLQLVVGHVFYLFYNFFSPILFIHYIFIYFIFAFSLWPLEWLFFVANFYIVWLRHSFFFFLHVFKFVCLWLRDWRWCHPRMTTQVIKKLKFTMNTQNIDGFW